MSTLAIVVVAVCATLVLLTWMGLRAASAEERRTMPADPSSEVERKLLILAAEQCEQKAEQWARRRYPQYMDDELSKARKLRKRAASLAGD